MSINLVIAFIAFALGLGYVMGRPVPDKRWKLEEVIGYAGSIAKDHPFYPSYNISHEETSFEIWATKNLLKMDKYPDDGFSPRYKDPVTEEAHYAWIGRALQEINRNKNREKAWSESQAAFEAHIAKLKEERECAK